MKPSESRVFAWLVIVFLVGCLASVVTYADDECRGHSCNGGDTILNGGDNTAENSALIGGSRSLSLGGSDMDIRNGYRSYSYLFGLIQETKANPLEVARQLQAEGNYEAAAYLRCQPWGIHRAYGGKENCIKILSVPVSVQSIPEPEAVVDSDDEDEHEEYEQQFAMFQQQIQELEQQVQKPKVVYRPEPELKERLDADKQRRAKTRAILEGNDGSE